MEPLDRRNYPTQGVEKCGALQVIKRLYRSLIMPNVNVELGDRSYNIQIGANLLNELGTMCQQHNLGQKCVIVTDSNVEAAYAEIVTDSLKASGFDPIRITIKPGEVSKNLQVVQMCYELLAKHRIERNSFIVALGGGVVGDLAGFVAATYLRGISLVQIPTTLLAQVDSSVGGKVGVNLPAGKNLVGSFHQPRFVICDRATLASLPDREYKAGLAEVIKYGIIYDAQFFTQLDQNVDLLMNRDPAFLDLVIARCCQIKAAIVGKDEKESGLRAILNFGHTIGHGLEAITGYGRLLHGEAISIGQIAAARLSHMRLGLSKHDVERITSVFQRVGLPITIVLDASERRSLLEAMNLDKKVVSGGIKFVLIKSIGESEFGLRVEESMVAEIVDTLHEQ